MNAPRFKLSYDVERSDYVGGFKAQFRRGRIVAPIVVLIAIFGFIIGPYSWWQPTAILFAALLWFNLQINVWRSFRRNPELRRRIQLEVSDHGLEFISTGSRLQLDWGRFSKLDQTDRLILLLVTKANVVVVPKRGFADQGQINEFIKFATSKINPDNQGPGSSVAGTASA